MTGREVTTTHINSPRGKKIVPFWALFFFGVWRNYAELGAAIL